MYILVLQQVLDFFICFRPYMKVYHKENGQNVLLGKIKAPCMCCNYAVEVYDAAKNLVYIIEASCC